MSQLPKTVIVGLQAFNQGNYYAAHEHFEDAWRATEKDSREFYRALLHLSGGFFRLTQNRPRAARKFFTRALHWLHDFPSPYLGLDTAEIKSRIHMLIASIDNGQPPDMILKQWDHPITPIDRQEYYDETVDHRF
jgi:hypothetical protein